MKLPIHKTKIVATLGPASANERILAAMVRSGLGVARLNMSHGSLEDHARSIGLVRRVSARLSRPVSILMDLPGPKIRLGRLAQEPVDVRRGQEVVFTTRSRDARPGRIPVDFKRLPQSVKPGGTIYLNDGFIQLRVVSVRGPEVKCRVLVGGQLRSRKGMNLPGARVLAGAVTAQDLAFVDFGLKHGVDIFGVSFVEDGEDIRRLKRHARRSGREVYAVAKIERPEAVENLDQILAESDAIMVARGDLGVEIPIEQVPVVQKELIRKANLAGRPVITATQMLLSMVDNFRPTRAEAADVANAILDGTDAVMLSEETAVGRYPVQAVRTMAAIAGSAEGHREQELSASAVEAELKGRCQASALAVEDALSLAVIDVLRTLPVARVLTPTHTGSTPRRISRFKPGAWVLAFTRFAPVREFLNLSYGVYPFPAASRAQEKAAPMLARLRRLGLIRKGERAVITEGLASGKGGTDSVRVATA